MTRSSCFIVFTNLRRAGLEDPCHTAAGQSPQARRMHYPEKEEGAWTKQWSERTADGGEIGDDLLRARLLDRGARGRRARLVRHRRDRRANLVGAVPDRHRPARHPSREWAPGGDTLTVDTL